MVLKLATLSPADFRRSRKADTLVTMAETDGSAQGHGPRSASPVRAAGSGDVHDTRQSTVHDMVAFFGPVLRDQTGARLSEIEWFRSAWQRSGAATGFATWTHDNGSQEPVMVKLPIGPVELRWTVAMGTCPDGDDPAALPCARVLAGGDELSSFDLAWVITERLQGPPMSKELGPEAATEILKAAADFQARALRCNFTKALPKEPDWEARIHRSRDLARAGAIAESQRWNEAIRRVQKSLNVLIARWAKRELTDWCHGDLHPGNALRRKSGRSCVLVDLALVHAGHWIEDALYLERQFWGHESKLGLKPLSVLARLRRERGLPTCGNYAELAHVKRVLAAAAAPAAIEREGNPAYLHAALDVIEQSLPQAVHG
jgi:hypothetical protein